jgi:hypothetical protein
MHTVLYHGKINSPSSAISRNPLTEDNKGYQYNRITNSGMGSLVMLQNTGYGESGYATKHYFKNLVFSYHKEPNISYFLSSMV